MCGRSERQGSNLTLDVGVELVAQLLGYKAATVHVNIGYVEDDNIAVLSFLQTCDCRVGRHSSLLDNLLQHAATIGVEIVLVVVNKEEFILSCECACLGIIGEHYVLTQ